MPLRAFAPTKSPIVATADWVPVTSPITPDSWGLNPDGSLAYEYAGAPTPAWDGILTGTHHGFTVFVDADGREWPEFQLELRTLDADETPGERVRFTTRREARPVFDAGLEERARRLVDAAETLLEDQPPCRIDPVTERLREAAILLRALLPKPAADPTHDAATAPTPDAGDAP